MCCVIVWRIALVRVLSVMMGRCVYLVQCIFFLLLFRCCHDSIRDSSAIRFDVMWWLAVLLLLLVVAPGVRGVVAHSVI